MSKLGKIALLVPQLPTAGELAPFLARIDAARWYSNYGPLARELERELLLRLSAGREVQPQLTSVSNCTAGLELGLLALGLKPGARVLVPGLTFVATATAVMRAGMEPVICDVDADNWLLTPEIARAAIGEAQVDAVMPVSTYGCPQDPAAWDAFVESTGVPVLVDAAGAFGNQWPGRRIGLVFSLHATKVLSSGEGGLVVSTDAAFLDEVRRLTNFGIHLKNGLVTHPGTNAKISEFHAAVGLAMLDQWEVHFRRRVALHRLYLETIKATCPAVKLQARPADGVYSIMPVLLPEGTTAAGVAQALECDGIETRRWYCPILEQHPAFASATVAGELRIARQVGERLLALPFHLHLRPDEVARVCDRLRAALGKLAE